uniref:Carboxylic ester hydrolase n=1 Tax=Parastrongyloides trichosuri TaxID=131310 RepID=A0A0N4ZQI4_PARTI
MGCKNSRIQYVKSAEPSSSGRNIHNNLIIQTNYGLVEGKSYTTNEGYTSNAFLGIPFAEPPVGELRFKKPIKPKKWDGILKATKYKNRSMQKDIFPEPITIFYKKSEDCLYLNIVTPNLINNPPTKKYPVMVYIHGGAFAIDCAARYDYKKLTNCLVKHDVIIVTIQYRLGFLGFFYTGDDTCESNLGLWDQYYALKWVYENIKNFGGDINNITLFGQSAGAVSSDLLSLSPYSRNLFNKLILMGGNADTIWGIGDKEKLIEICRNKAIKLGFVRSSNNDEWSKEDNIEMMEYLKKLPAEKLGNTMMFESKYFKEGILDNAPIVDGDFIPKTINVLRKEVPPKPCIVGVCKYEGLLFVGLYKWKINEKLKKMIINNLIYFFSKRNITLKEEEVEELGNLKSIECNKKQRKMFKKRIVSLFGDIVNNVAVKRYCQERMSSQITEQLSLEKSDSIKRNSYSSGDSGFGEKSISNESINNLSPTQSDKDIVTNSNNNTPVYLYRFDHYNRRHLMAFQLTLPFVAATHATELFYIFDAHLFVIPFKMTEEDKMVREQVNIWWTNFAKFGNPNDKNDQNNNKNKIIWKPIQGNVHNFMKIKNNPEMGEDFGGVRLKKLADLFNEAYKYDSIQNYHKSKL